MNLSKLVATGIAVAALALPAASKAEDKPGEFKIPGTDSTLKLYGYVQLDTTFDFNGRDPNVEGDDYATILATVPLNSSAEAKIKDKQLYLTARTSRFGIQTNTPTGVGPVTVKLEGDFNTGNILQGQNFTNSMIFRLRHGYGQIDTKAGSFLVGQTWTNFIDLASYPDVVDFNGPGSLALIRQPQFRYTATLAPNISLAVAAENAPGIDDNDYAIDLGALGAPNIGPGRTIQTIPDFTAALSASGGWGTASVRGVTRQVKRADSATDPTRTYSKQGYGGQVAGAFKLGGDTVVAMGVYGSGLGRYLLNSALTVGSRGMIDVNGNTDLVAVESGAYHVGYTHVWNPMFRSNLVWSQTFVQNPKEKGIDFSNSGTNRRMDQVFVNTFWTVAKTVEFGLEYEWGRRIQYNDLEGRMNRVTGTFHYNFF